MKPGTSPPSAPVMDDLALLTTPPNLSLEGRCAWITGASRGLGKQLALAFAGAGAELILSARSAEPLNELAVHIRAHGGVVEVAAGSITDPNLIKRTTRLIDARWGRLDVLVNNAGISPSFVRSEALTEADWQAVMDVNLVAPLACCSAALPFLVAAGGGSIVNISSVHGVRAHERLVAYAASKGALEMVTRTLAVEWAGHNVRVNAVAPGYLETDMTAGLREHEKWSERLTARIPMGRFAKAAEVVPSVLLLAGAGSSYMTGTTIYVDGGWTAM